MKKPHAECEGLVARPVQKVIWVIVFSMAMGFLEAAVVVYLRALYYPEGFAFPLLMIEQRIAIVELSREVATLVMLCAIAGLAGRGFWDKLAYFILSFGVWDIFYYVWLKVTLGWPPSMATWDILFLLPLPWIGPVIAPVSIACLMILIGLVITLHPAYHDFRPSLISWGLAVVATVIILYSFMRDIDATLRQALPSPYRYELLVIGDLLYIIAFLKVKRGHRRDEPNRAESCSASRDDDPEC